MAQVGVDSIEAICKQKLRLDSEAVLDSDNQQAVAKAVTQLQRSYEEAATQGGDPAVLDPVADLKLNQLEVVDSVRERQRLMQVSISSLIPPPPPGRTSSWPAPPHPTPPHPPSPFYPRSSFTPDPPSCASSSFVPPTSPPRPPAPSPISHATAPAFEFVGMSLTALFAVHDTQMLSCLCNR